uniref:Basic protein n=1 Tax=uncultured bacterium contig00045 TaxID=1181531 RepID=A0A806KDK3_9BACT|nr:basic protein [uncultured bacterium contig00045]
MAACPVCGDVPGATDTTERGNTAGNTANHGLAAIAQDGRVYYSNTSANGELYSMNPDGTDARIVCGDVALFINALGDRLYYVNLGEGFTLHTVKTDGTDRQKLGDDAAYNVTLYGDRLYYTNLSDDYNLYTIKTDGTDIDKLYAQGVESINAAYGTLYLSTWTPDGFVIYGMDLDADGSGSGEVFSAKRSSLDIAYSTGVYAAGGRLYLIASDSGNNYTLYSMDLGGGDLQRLEYREHEDNAG